MVMVEASKTEKSWLAKNWKWLVLVLATGCIAFPIGLIVMIFGLIKNTTPYKVAVQEAETDQRIIELIGEPIEPGWWVSGSTETSGGKGSADLMIPVSGPDGRMTIYVEAQKSAGAWTYETIIAESEDSKQRINLLPIDDQLQ